MRRGRKKPELWRNGLPEKIQEIIVSFLGLIQPEIRNLVTKSILELGGLEMGEKEVLAGAFGLMDGDNGPTLVKCLAAMPLDQKRQIIFCVKHLSKTRFVLELLSMEYEEIMMLAEHLEYMNDDERAKVLEASEKFTLNDVPKVLKMDLEKMHLCSVCKAKREEETEFKLRYDLEKEKETVQGAWQDFGAKLYELRVEGLGGENAPPPPESGLPELWFGKYKPVKINTKQMCQTCRQEVYGYVTTWGNDMELWHLQGWEKRVALNNVVWAAKVKQQWWQAERVEQNRMKLMQAVQEGRKGAAARTELARRRKIKEDAESKVAEEQRKRRESVENAIEKGLLTDQKWKDHNDHHRRSLLRRKYLYAALQVERDFGTSSHHATSERLNPLSWHRKDTIADGVPITPFRAAQVFGETQPEPENDLPELRTWFKEGAAKYKHFDMRRKAREQQLETGKKQALETETVYWKGLAADVESKLQQEETRKKWVRDQRQKRRQYARDLASKRRAAIRREAQRRREEEEEMIQRSLSRLKLQKQNEEAERRRMAAAEAEQTEIDRFWGIPTEWERLRRLEEERRRRWEERIKNQNKVLRHVKATDGEEAYFDFLDPMKAGEFKNDFLSNPGVS